MSKGIRKKLFSGKKSLRTGKEAGSPHNDGKEETLVFLNFAQMGRICKNVRLADGKTPMRVYFIENLPKGKKNKK